MIDMSLAAITPGAAGDLSPASRAPFLERQPVSAALLQPTPIVGAREIVVVLIAILATWIGLAVSVAVSKAPWSNEGWCALPAVNRATQGYMGTTVLVSKGTWLVGVERHTYWMMPMHILAQD